MSTSKRSSGRRQSTKRISFGVPRKSKRVGRSEGKNAFVPNEDWHEPIEGERDGYRIIEKDPGEGLFHPVTPQEIISRLEKLPDWVVEDLDVIQLSDVTKKKKRFPCYGLQWGTAVYLYPVDEDLIEVFAAAPHPKLQNETRMFGGEWEYDASQHLWFLHWTEKTIRDFYLNNVLIHELGHLVDDRNTGYDARERYADWFAIEYGYKPSRSKKSIRKRQSGTKKRHHME